MSSKVCMILVWFFVICLLVVGLVMVSSTAAWAEETKHPYEPLFKQTAFACAGLVGAMILSRIDYRIWRKYIWWILGGACFLLVLCYVPGIGKEINGERRWITIGMQFQPAPAWCDGVQGEVGAMRLKLHASGRCGEHSAAIPVEILFLMNMSAQQIFHAREVHQHAV